MTSKLSIRMLAGFVCLLMLLPFAMGASGAKDGIETYDVSLTEMDNSLSDSLMEELYATSGVAVNSDGKAEKIDDNQIVRAVITLDEPALFSYKNVGNDTKGDFAIFIKERISQQQKSVKTDIEGVLGHSLDVKYTYSKVLNGFAVSLPYGELDTVAEIDGVKSASICGFYTTCATNDMEGEEKSPAISPDAANTTEYQGEGMVIAVLDTGLQMNHPMFAGDVPEPAFSRNYIDQIIESGELLATERMPRFSSNQAYKRVKIPFQFDYGYDDADAGHDGGSYHGTHVAGIACGNLGVNSSVDPVAPNAQLVVMKVFVTEGGSEGAYDDDIVAAIEDSAILGVDVINMSLGSPAGFTSLASWENMESALSNAKNAGVLISASAGNEGSASNGATNSMFYSINPDYSMVGSPSVFLTCLSIASHTSGSESQRRMSDFSSWGAAPDLTLKPELSAFGDDVYSSVPTNSYTYASGTSMAAPHVSGGMAAIKQYLKLLYPAMSEVELFERTITLLMNTADQVMDETQSSIPVSVRKQGAGAMNVANAIGTPAYVTVDGSERPKFDGMDDIDETGTYTFTFTIHNVTRSALEYEITAIPLTERADTINGPEGQTTVMSETPYLLDAQISVQGGSNIVTVGAGESLNVVATLALTRKDVEYIRNNFVNGCYVEGFIKLIAREANDIDLTIPFLRYFGDFTKPPVLDSGFFFNEINGEPDWTNIHTNKIYTRNGSSDLYLGTNPVGTTTNYFDDRTTLSPNGDGRIDAIERLQLGLVRSSRLVSYTVTGEDGTVYYQKNVPFVSRSFYFGYYGMLYCGYYDEQNIGRWAGTDANGNTLPNNTKAFLTIKAEVDYDKHESNCVNDTWVIPITIDTQSPQIHRATVSYINGRKYLDVTASDNHYLANISVTNSAYSTNYISKGIYETQSGFTNSYRFDITDIYYTNLGLVATDYGANRTTCLINIGDILDDNQPITQDMKIAGSDFEDSVFPPAGFSLGSTASALNTWTRAEGDTYVARVEPSSDAQNEWLILDEVNLADYENQVNVAFRFSTELESMTGDAEANVSLRISTDGINYSTIYSTADELDFASFENVERRVRIPYAYQDEAVHLAFVYEGQNGARFDLDNVFVYDNNTPVLPEGGSSENLTIDNSLNVDGGELEFTNDSHSPWIPSAQDLRTLAYSGNAGVGNSESSLTLNAGMLEAQTTLKFDWMVSSEFNYDWLSFYVNGQLEKRISGSSSWVTCSYTAAESDTYIFKWTYSKDSSLNSGDDKGYLDNVCIQLPISVTGVNFQESELTLELGGLLSPTVIVEPENATNKDCVFSSSDSSIVSVDDDGTITALAVGIATITVMSVDGGYSDECLITVMPESPIPQGYARIKLTAANPWGDATGYQLLLDSDAAAYGSIIPIAGPLTLHGDASEYTYYEFEYKIPQNADGATTTNNVVLNTSMYIDVPAGTYDLCVTNPVPGDKIWIAGGQYARCNDISIESGYVYTFTCLTSDSGDNVTMESKYIGNDPNTTPILPTPTPTIIPTPTATNVPTPTPTNVPTPTPTSVPTPTPTNAPTPTPTNVPTPTITPYELGDANLDGELNTGDASYILRYCVNLETMSELQLEIADINRDGETNTGDSAMILRTIAMLLK